MTFYHSSLRGNHHKLATQRFVIWSSISRTVWILFGLFSWMALRLNTFIPYIIGLHTHDMSQNVLQLLLPEKNISSSRCFSRFTIVLSRISVLLLGMSSMALNFVVLCLCVLIQNSLWSNTFQKSPSFCTVDFQAECIVHPRISKRANGYLEMGFIQKMAWF